jgi:hypothetical protein
MRYEYFECCVVLEEIVVKSMSCALIVVRVCNITYMKGFTLFLKLNAIFKYLTAL